MVVVPLLLLLSVMLLPVRERKGLSLFICPLLGALRFVLIRLRLGMGVVDENRE